jgi:hypothetical protein
MKIRKNSVAVDRKKRFVKLVFVSYIRKDVKFTLWNAVAGSALEGWKGCASNEQRSNVHV